MDASYCVTKVLAIRAKGPIFHSFDAVSVKFGVFNLGHEQYVLKRALFTFRNVAICSLTRRTHHGQQP